MSEEHDVTFNLELDVSRVYDNTRKLETLFYRIFSLLGRLGLPEEIDAAIYKIQRMIMTIRLAHTAIIAFQAASGPVGWALALAGGVTVALTASDFMMSLGE